MRAGVVIAGFALGLWACATQGPTGPRAPAGKLGLESTAGEVYERCVRFEDTGEADALFDCDGLQLAVHVGDDGQDFLDARLASAIAQVGAGPVRAAPFLLPVGGRSSTVLRTVVYADAEEEHEAMIHLGVFVTDAHMALSCVARADLPANGDVCARVIDQVALDPPRGLVTARPAAEGPGVEAELFGVTIALPKDCSVAAGPETTEVTCPFAKATLRQWVSSEDASAAAAEPAQVLRAYGARVELRPLSCQILGGTGGCKVGEVKTDDGDGQGLVFGSAAVNGAWLSLECTAPTGISDPLCRALVVVH